MSHLSFEQIQKKFPEATETSRGNGAAYVVNCWKHHKHGGVAQMEISPEGVFYCHNCNHAGTLFKEFPDHFDDLEEYFPWIEVKRGSISEAAPTKSRIFRSGIMWAQNLPAPGETVPISSLSEDHPAIEYLRGRGFDIDQLKSYNAPGDTRGLYYCTRGQINLQCDLGTLSGRVVFPVYMDETGAGGRLASVLSGWQARQIDHVDEEDAKTGTKRTWNGFSWKKFYKKDGIWEDKYVPKYYTSPGRKKTSMLGGIQAAKGSSFVVVVEGPVDKYKVGDHGVFSFGKHLSNDQIRLLQGYWSTAILIRDPEIDPSSKSYREMIDRMHPLRVYDFALLDGKDAGATTTSGIWTQIADHVGDPSLKLYGEKN
jgi:hypothetical protein